MHQQPIFASPIHSIDVRPIPRPLRHALVLSSFEALGPDDAVELVSDHDPRPLRYLFDVRYPDAFTWDYVEQGPSIWRVRIGRNDRLSRG